MPAHADWLHLNSRSFGAPVEPTNLEVKMIGLRGFSIQVTVLFLGVAIGLIGLPTMALAIQPSLFKIVAPESSHARDQIHREKRRGP
jgi:hypothetical protein